MLDAITMEVCNFLERKMPIRDWLCLSKICPLCLKISSFNEMQLTLSTRPQEGKARGAMREALAAKVCLPPALATMLCLLWLPPLLLG